MLGEVDFGVRFLAQLNGVDAAVASGLAVGSGHSRGYTDDKARVLELVADCLVKGFNLVKAGRGGQGANVLNDVDGIVAIGCAQLQLLAQSVEHLAAFSGGAGGRGFVHALVHSQQLLVLGNLVGIVLFEEPAHQRPLFLVAAAVSGQPAKPGLHDVARVEAVVNFQSAQADFVGVEVHASFGSKAFLVLLQDAQVDRIGQTVHRVLGVDVADARNAQCGALAERHTQQSATVLARVLVVCAILRNDVGYCDTHFSLGF